MSRLRAILLVEWVSALELFHLGGTVLVNELLDGHESTTNLDLRLSTVDFNRDSSRAEHVDAFLLAVKHDPQLRFVRVIVHEFS